MSDRSRWLTTFSGGRFYPGDPEGTDYRITDIAHGLSMVCRFAGQSREFYSVASHSVLVAHILNHHIDYAPTYKLSALLHDAAEAYLGDLARAVKYSPELEGYRDLEGRVLAAIYRKFRVPLGDPNRLRQADKLALRCEASYLGLLKPSWDEYSLPDLGLRPTLDSPREAERAFLSVFKELA